MTPEERAEKMAREYANNFNLNQADEIALSNDIAAEIRAAVAGEKTLALIEFTEMAKGIEAAIREKARAEAYEDAAQIAEQWIDGQPTQPFQMSGSDVAALIRARAKELSGIISERRIDNSEKCARCGKPATKVGLCEGCWFAC